KARVEHRNLGFGARKQLAVDVDQDRGVARIVGEGVRGGHGRSHRWPGTASVSLPTMPPFSPPVTVFALYWRPASAGRSEHGRRATRTLEPASRARRRGGGVMPFFLVEATYTPEAWAKLVENPQDRTEPTRQVAEAFGGRMHHVFFAFGTYDVV